MGGPFGIKWLVLIFAHAQWTLTQLAEGYVPDWANTSPELLDEEISAYHTARDGLSDVNEQLPTEFTFAEFWEHVYDEVSSDPPIVKAQREVELDTELSRLADQNISARNISVASKGGSRSKHPTAQFKVGPVTRSRKVQQNVWFARTFNGIYLLSKYHKNGRRKVSELSTVGGGWTPERNSMRGSATTAEDHRRALGSNLRHGGSSILDDTGTVASKPQILEEEDVWGLPTIGVAVADDSIEMVDEGSRPWPAGRARGKPCIGTSNKTEQVGTHGFKSVSFWPGFLIVKNGQIQPGCTGDVHSVMNPLLDMTSEAGDVGSILISMSQGEEGQTVHGILQHGCLRGWVELEGGQTALASLSTWFCERNGLPPIPPNVKPTRLFGDTNFAMIKTLLVSKPCIEELVSAVLRHEALDPPQDDLGIFARMATDKAFGNTQILPIKPDSISAYMSEPPPASLFNAQSPDHLARGPLGYVNWLSSEPFNAQSTTLCYRGQHGVVWAVLPLLWFVHWDSLWLQDPTLGAGAKTPVSFHEQLVDSTMSLQEVFQGWRVRRQPPSVVDVDSEAEQYRGSHASAHWPFYACPSMTHAVLMEQEDIRQRWMHTYKAQMSGVSNPGPAPQASIPLQPPGPASTANLPDASAEATAAPPPTAAKTKGTPGAAVPSRKRKVSPPGALDVPEMSGLDSTHLLQTCSKILIPRFAKDNWQQVWQRGPGTWKVSQYI
ncbi:hypothetical protein BDV93DRAFT_513915 [Ceratobasidium sp. AG-I]|nr:hypothetical protein BDV93DRAFT_513915 [Ceratobasidium sp. AG-I]